MCPDTALPIKSVSIDTLLMRRQAAVDRLEQARDLLADAAKCLTGTGAHLGDALRYKGRDTMMLTDPKDFDLLLRKIDSSIWGYLMDQSGLLTFMDREAKQKWREGVYECKSPPLTRENIELTFKGVHESRHELFERGIIRAFRRLSWNYKTNSPVAFGKRIILNGLVRKDGKPVSSTCDDVDDLVRAFHLLDQKPEPDHRHGAYSMMSAARQQGKSEWECEYLAIRWFKKGTGHITFKYPELVLQMNRIIAKHFPDALPAVFD